MEYLVSVVTPFHNVEMDVFRNACESMISQTIGFDNVEWVVVVHNSEKRLLDGVRERLEKFPNVVIDVLNNEIRSPSSPRNRGLELASAPYVGFLDADDSFTPECLEIALAHMKKNQSQITWFRREYELESEDTVPITEIVLWDQTREEIIIDREHWDDEKMFSGICGMVTSRLYEKKFLDKYGIRFDESVPFAEDYLFNLEAYGHAKKICYLPQLIGYHYYINKSSLVQSSGKDAKTLIAYAKGYKKVFDTGLGYGFFMNAIVLGLCCVLARFLIASDKLTLEDRITIRDILAPYLEMMTPLKVSKLYSEKQVKERYDFPREVILHPDRQSGEAGTDTLIAVDVRTEQALPQYQRLLRDILNINQDSDIGRRYDFVDILTLSGYQAKIPVTGHEFYGPIIRLQTNVGESKILTSDDIRNYIFITGEKGLPELIPCTSRQIRPIRKLLEKSLVDRRTFLMMESLPRINRHNDNTYSNTAYGTVLTDLYADPKFLPMEKKRMFTAPYELLFPEEVANLTYVRLFFALSDPDMDQILAPNTWTVWEAFYDLERLWRNLCEDIARGKLSSFNEISDEFKANLESRIVPNPARAAELAAIFSQGFDTPVAPRIWKKLSRIIAFGTGTFAIYTQNIKRYTGDIELMNGPYLSAQAILGSEMEKTGLYRLAFKNAFVEFEPVSEEDGKRRPAVLAPDVEVGKDYAILITTYSGLYRYRLNEVVHIDHMSDGFPVFSYEYDVRQTMKLHGVSVTERLIRESLLTLVRETGFEIADYAYRKSEAEDRIVVLLEPKSEDVSAERTEDLAEILEREMERQSAPYRQAVAAGELQPVKVGFIEPETQFLYRDLMMQHMIRSSADFVKPVRYIDTPAKSRLFQEMGEKL